MRPRRFYSYRHLGCLGLAHFSSAADEHFCDEESQRSKQRPVKLLPIYFCLAGIQIVASEGAEPLVVDRAQPFALLAEGLIHAAGRLGDLLECDFVEVRFHELARSVFGEIGPTILTRHGHEVAGSAADADGKNLQPALCRLFRGGNALAAQVLTVGDEHENSFRRRAGLEYSVGFADCGGNVCAATWNYFRIERVERFPEGVVVERHRALQKGVACKSHKAHAVAVQLVHEIVHSELCARKSIRLYVLGEHAL